MKLPASLIALLTLAGLPDRIVAPPANTAPGPFSFVDDLDTNVPNGTGIVLTSTNTLTVVDPGWTQTFGAASANPEIMAVYDRIKVEVGEGAITPAQATALFSALYLTHTAGNVTRKWSLASCAGTYLPDAATDTTTAGVSQNRRSRRAFIFKLPYPIQVDYSADTLAVQCAVNTGVGTVPVVVTLFGGAWKQSVANAGIQVVSPADSGAYLADLAAARGFANVARVGRNVVAGALASRLGR